MTFATSAYRRDYEANQKAFGESDGEWIAVASLVEQASSAPASERGNCLAHAEQTARGLLADKLETLAQREWNGSAGDYDGILLLANIIQDAGAVHLAAAVTDGMLRILGGEHHIKRGRFIALRGRVAHKFGQLEYAEDAFRQVVRLGNRIDNDELRVRGLIGLGAIAQRRGDYPSVLRLSRKAVRLAEKFRAPLLAFAAHHGVTRGAFAAGRFDEAVNHGWRMVELSVGDLIQEAISIATLAQIFLELGDYATARAAFAHIATKALPYRILLPAIGGLATIAAHRDDRRELDWAVGEITALRRSVAPRTDYAAALLEATNALFVAGRTDEAEALRREGKEIAESLGLHELDFRAQALRAPTADARRRTSVSLKPSSSAVVSQLRELEPRQLPHHVTFADAA